VGIVNRRNAVLGWAAWQIGKRIARRKAKAAVPAIDSSTRRPNTSAILIALAAVAGAVWFWRRRGDDGSAESSEA
jgi:ferric-dicitrate binding protein FerR (iron transport regulator)